MGAKAAVASMQEAVSQPAFPESERLNRIMRNMPVSGSAMSTGSSPFRETDRLVQRAIGGLTFGISPASLFQAQQDWAVRLDRAPAASS